MNQIIHGKNLLVFLDDVAIAANKDCTLEIDIEMQEKTGASATWKDYILKRKSWTVSTGHLLTHDMALNLPSLMGKKVKLAFGLSEDHASANVASKRTLDGFAYVGYAICKKSSVKGAVHGLAQGSFSFVGCGPLDTEDNYTYLTTSDSKSFTTSDSKHFAVKKYND